MGDFKIFGYKRRKAKTTGLALWMSVPTENIFKISYFLKGGLIGYD